MTPVTQPPSVAPRAMPSAEEAAIARSVLYASLFDYPLTLAQLRATLIESAQTPTEILECYARSDRLQAAITYHEGFFYPRGRHGLVRQRRLREALSRGLLERHWPLLSLISTLPYVRLVALSGSIAHLNLDGAGDLDLFVVTRGQRVWSVTVGIVLLAKLMGCRRSLCANFVIADSRLELEQQDLFSANQLIHLRPLVGHDVYRRLLGANPFVFRFYPNFHTAKPGTLAFRPGHVRRAAKRMVELLMWGPSALAERVCRGLYRGYLLRRASSWRSPEQVRLEHDYLKLHTRSHRRSVLKRFEHVTGAISRPDPQLTTDDSYPQLAPPSPSRRP